MMMIIESGTERTTTTTAIPAITATTAIMAIMCRAFFIYLYFCIIFTILVVYCGYIC